MKHPKRALITLICALALLAGCGQPARTSPPSTPTAQTSAARSMAQIRVSGSLRIAVCANIAPYAFAEDYMLDPPTKYVGCDIALGRHIAQQLGLSAEFHYKESVEEVLQALRQGACDMALGALGDRPERREAFLMSVPFERNIEMSLLTRRGEEGRYARLEDVDQPSVRIAVQATSIQNEMMTLCIPNAYRVFVAHLPQGAQKLKEGKADLLAVNRALAQRVLESAPELALSNVVVRVSDEKNYVLFPKGSEALAEQVNPIIAIVEASGQYALWQQEAQDLTAQWVIDAPPQPSNW
nr:transporter substrate-binding domain-containing protein [Maliibacterium massiliense]